MHFFNFFISAAAFSASQVLAAQTVFLAGDSTMATWRAGSELTGWGEYFPKFCGLPVENHAMGGRSARSFTREGRFQQIADKIKQNDYCVMEFGHNDGGGLGRGDNGRSACGTEVCQTTFEGKPETVYSYEAYLVNATRLLQSKGCRVIISSKTPDDTWNGTPPTFSYTPSRFVGMAENAAKEAGVVFVDHGKWVAQQYQELGAKTVDSFYPVDHKHTSRAGAQVVAKAFALAVKDSTSDFKRFIKGVA